MPSGVRNAVPRDLVPGFAKLIKTAREGRQWSQRTLAKEANLSPMCVCNLEAENRSPSLRVAMQLAAALGLEVLLREPVTRVKSK